MRALRCFLPLILLPMSAMAAVVPGDTLFTAMPSGEMSFVVDGTRVVVQTICTASIPGTCQSSVVTSYSVFLDPKLASKGVQPYFLHQYQSCGVVGSGCYVSRVDFVDTLSWQVIGKDATWILKFDSLEFRTEIHPEASPPSVGVVFSMKASWTPRPTAAIPQRVAPSFDASWPRVDPMGRTTGPGQAPGSDRPGLEIRGPSKVSIPGL